MGYVQERQHYERCMCDELPDHNTSNLYVCYCTRSLRKPREITVGLFLQCMEASSVIPFHESWIPIGRDGVDLSALRGIQCNKMS